MRTFNFKILIIFGYIISIFISSTVVASSRMGNEVIYLIMVDRFFNGNPQNDIPLYAATTDLDRMLMQRMLDPTHHEDYNRNFGGDLRGVIQKMDYLESLGVTAIWLTPLIENTYAKVEGGGFSKTAYHGYWGKNWYRMAPNLTDASLTDRQMMKELIGEAHRHGIKVILDIVLNHSSPINGSDRGAVYGPRGERIADWNQNQKGFLKTTFEPVLQPSPSWYHAGDIPWYKEKLSSQDFSEFMLDGLANFDTKQAVVKDYIFGATKMWLDYGVDGFRIDALRHIPLEFVQEFEKVVLRQNPKALLIGEYFSGGSVDVASQDYINKTNRLTIFDFNLRDTLYEAFHPKKRSLQSLKKLVELINLNSPLRSELVTFLDNHDYPRFLSEGGDSQSFLAALSVLFSLPGSPTLFYGNENLLFDPLNRIGFLGQIGGDPYNRPLMDFNSQGISSFTKEIRRLVSLRTQHPFLQRGQVHASLEKKHLNYYLTITNQEAVDNGTTKQTLITTLKFDSHLLVTKIQIKQKQL